MRQRRGDGSGGDRGRSDCWLSFCCSSGFEFAWLSGSAFPFYLTSRTDDMLSGRHTSDRQHRHQNTWGEVRNIDHIRKTRRKLVTLGGRSLSRRSTFRSTAALPVEAQKWTAPPAPWADVTEGGALALFPA